MYLLTKTCVRTAGRKGQAMTGYAPIPAAVGVVAFLTHQSPGNKIGTVLNDVWAREAN